MTAPLPTAYPGLFRSPDFAPRVLFSVSQIEKAFGSAQEPGRGCLRAWALRYLWGLKGPEYTWAEACALPEDTADLKKLKAGIKAKTLGKAFHSVAEQYYKGAAPDLSNELWVRFWSGSHLAPHPSECEAIETEGPVNVRLGEISFQGFKDLVVRYHGRRWLFDWKTTKPTVDNRRNEQAGKPRGSWTWMKDEAGIVIDYQANLYAYDEYLKHGALPAGRWVYFASQGKAEARATDYVPNETIVLQSVVKLYNHGIELRGLIEAFRAGQITAPEQVTPNVANCPAFGGCEYRAKVGGPCNAEQTEVIPVGALLAHVTRPSVAARPARADQISRAIGPDFSFQP